jgi:hypothetical protein
MSNVKSENELQLTAFELNKVVKKVTKISVAGNEAMEYVGKHTKMKVEI